MAAGFANCHPERGKLPPPIGEGRGVLDGNHRVGSLLLLTPYPLPPYPSGYAAAILTPHRWTIPDHPLSGISTVKVAPRPGPSEWAVTSPWWDRTMLRAIVSPMPVPVEWGSCSAR